MRAHKTARRTCAFEGRGAVATITPLFCCACEDRLPAWSLYGEQTLSVFLLRGVGMRRAMVAKVWRERVTYTAMSLFVAWHTLAMIVAPAPGASALIRGLRIVFQPYLSFFRIDNEWNFFAPNVAPGLVLRYVIKDDAGVDHSFKAAAGLNWFHPSYIWVRSWYFAV